MSFRRTFYRAAGLLAMSVACLPVLTSPAALASSPQLSVAEFGAVGDGITDDTAAIQAAIDALPTGGTLVFPALTYRIATDVGVRLKDDINVLLGSATLLGPNVAGGRCRILYLEGVSRVVISGGTLVGSRSGTPSFGVGILASDADDITIRNVKLQSFYSDGILLTGNVGCQRVLVSGAVSDGNRRSGMSVVAASDVRVEFSTFTGTSGQSPEAGVNCEANVGGQLARLAFVASTFVGNEGPGLLIQRGQGKAVSNVSVESSLLRDNDQGIVATGVGGVSLTNNRVFAHVGPSKTGIILGANTTGNVVKNQVAGNYRGILSIGASNVTIQGNQVTGLGPTATPAEDADGIVCRGVTTYVPLACVISGNTVTRFAGNGILTELVARIRVFGNAVDQVGERGVHMRYTNYSEVTGNTLSRVGLEQAGVFDTITLTHTSSYNVVTGNVCHLGTAARDGVVVAADCIGNQTDGNTVVADLGLGLPLRASLRVRPPASAGPHRLPRS